MRPLDVAHAWLAAFNGQDAERIANLYAEDAVIDHIFPDPIRGRSQIRKMFTKGFAASPLVCIVENLFEAGEWVILEWRDPKGLRGCALFRVVDGLIVFSRAYWDRIEHMKLHGATALQAAE